MLTAKSKLSSISRSLSRYLAIAVITLSATNVSSAYASSPSATKKIEVTDSRGVHQLDQHPQRIVALNWDITEQLLELGVTPIAMPDMAGYTEWVVKPALPDDIEDIGTRVEPNYEKIASLKPDLIMIASPQLDLLPQLERIAPVMFYQTYSGDHNNAEAAIENFRHIAKLVDKEAEADARLAHMEQRFSELKQQLETAYNGKLPKVATLRFASTTSVYLYGENAMSRFALAKLGIDAAMPQPSNQWGVSQKRITDLQQVGSGTVLYFLPFAQEEQLKKSVMWQAMPFVRQHRVNSVNATWSYGGAMSILYIAEALTASLLEIAPE
ncbi:iron-siderophore ABC transporter substrate-binding protein [Photobacterium makurazakiensis]|uniref:ABC transporter substrate-binding protein n=1 Tax=Photobacterium makurazakiensis TaxID=2910234 RepID=UPI003D0B5F54